MTPVDYSENLPEGTRDVIRDYNKMIATYMGYKYYPYNEPGMDKKIEPGWKIHADVPSLSKMRRDKNDFLCRNHRELAYHYDWNWLMPVIVELHKRHGFLIYYFGMVIFSSHVMDLNKSNKDASTPPEFFYHQLTVKSMANLIEGMWEATALTIEYIMRHGDPQIPVVEKYGHKFEKNKFDLPDSEVQS